MKVVIAATALTLAMSVTAHAHEGTNGVVKERMESMKTIGQQVKIMVPMMKGALPYDPAKVAEAARIIQGHAGQSFIDLFPEGSDDHPSEARSDVWSDWNDFSELSMKLEGSAATLAKVAIDPGNEDDFKGALRDVLMTCKSCHQQFRED